MERNFTHHQTIASPSFTFFLLLLLLFHQQQKKTLIFFVGGDLNEMPPKNKNHCKYLNIMEKKRRSLPWYDVRQKGVEKVYSWDSIITIYILGVFNSFHSAPKFCLKSISVFVSPTYYYCQPNDSCWWYFFIMIID